MLTRRRARVYTRTPGRAHSHMRIHAHTPAHDLRKHMCTSPTCTHTYADMPTHAASPRGVNTRPRPRPSRGHPGPPGRPC